MTPANIGEQLEERRATLIREALDFPEELDSTEYCKMFPRYTALISMSLTEFEFDGSVCAHI